MKNKLLILMIFSASLTLTMSKRSGNKYSQRKFKKIKSSSTLDDKLYDAVDDKLHDAVLRSDVEATHDFLARGADPKNHLYLAICIKVSKENSLNASAVHSALLSKLKKNVEEKLLKIPDQS